MGKEKNIQALADRSLTTKQLETLKLICRFRFATTELIATNKNKKRDATINAHVRVLHERGYIGRRYDASYKLRGKHAAYYLLPKGLSALKERDESILLSSKTIYNDRTASDKFVDFCLEIGSLAQLLLSYYGEEARVFTRTDLLAYDYFPQPIPDLYMTIKRKPLRHYFVDVYDGSTPAFVPVKKIKRYIAHSESGEWEMTGSDYPEVVIACTSTAAEQRLRKKLLPVMDEVRGDLTAYTCTVAGLSDITSQANPFHKV